MSRAKKTHLYCVSLQTSLEYYIKARTAAEAKEKALNRARRAPRKHWDIQQDRVDWMME